MLTGFLINAAIGGMALAIIASILGSFVLWKNMTYFGDALSHSSLLGVTLGVLLNINLSVAVILIAIIFAVSFNKNRFQFSNDTMLGIISYVALALAIIIASYSKIKIDLVSYLFGDILVIDNSDIICLLICVLITLLWLYFYWAKLLMFCINEDLLQAEGCNVGLVKLSFTVILALFIAISFKIVGIFLITAMLIIPPAAALSISKTPTQMIVYAIIIGCISIMAGIGLAIAFNIPTGPAIILVSFAFLILNNIIKITFAKR